MVRGDWTINASEEVYQNPWISVNHHSVITPGGTQGIYGEVHFKNLAIGIIPLDDQGYTWRVGQFRFPLNRYSWEIPEGGGPIHIDPLVSAQRELQEEVGLQADKWERLLELDLSNSVTNERSIVYVAEGLTQVSMEHEDTENLTIEKIPFFELYQDVMNGLVRDSISVAAVLKLAIQRPGLLEI
jgi:8-oxo-dGTP pyrophosphatase MutT (NUDIX family)